MEKDFQKIIDKHTSSGKTDWNEISREMEKYYLSYTPRQWFKEKIRFDYIKYRFGEAFGEAFVRFLFFWFWFIPICLPIEGYLNLRETNEFMYKIAMYVVFSSLFLVTFCPTLIIIYQCCRNKWFDFYPVK